MVLLGSRHRRAYRGTTTVTEALATNPFALLAIPPMTCVPFDIFFFCHVAEQEVTLAHAARRFPSAVIAIDAMPFAEVAETAILRLPFTEVPLVGELIVMLGAEAGVGAGVVTDTLDDWADVLPAAS